MKNWKTVKVGEIAVVANGKTPSRDEQKNEGLPILKIKDITADGRFKGICSTFVAKSFYSSYKKKALKCGDTLFLNAAHNSDYVGSKNYFATNEVEGIIPTGEWLIISGNNEAVHPRFLYFYLTSSLGLSFIKDIVKGIHLYPKDVAKIPIPLPPLAEQIHIAQVLDQADRLRQQDRQLLAHYDQLVQAVFMDMFGDPVRNEKGWPVHKLRTAILDIVGGTSYSGEERDLEEGELGVLKVSAVTKGNFDASEFKAVSKSIINKKIIKPRKGDLLFSRANTRELVAATCIVDKDYEDLFLPDKIWRIDFDKDLCNSVFFKHLLSKPKFRNELTKTATGTSGSMLNVSMEKLRSLKVPLPAIEKQNQFAAIATQVEAQKAATQQLLARSEALFNSLLQQAFRGELGLPKPADKAAAGQLRLVL